MDSSSEEIIIDFVDLTQSLPSTWIVRIHEIKTPAQKYWYYYYYQKHHSTMKLLQKEV